MQGAQIQFKRLTVCVAFSRSTGAHRSAGSDGRGAGEQRPGTVAARGLLHGALLSPLLGTTAASVRATRAAKGAQSCA